MSPVWPVPSYLSSTRCVPCLTCPICVLLDVSPAWPVPCLTCLLFDLSSTRPAPCSPVRPVPCLTYPLSDLSSTRPAPCSPVRPVLFDLSCLTCPLSDLSSTGPAPSSTGPAPCMTYHLSDLPLVRAVTCLTCPYIVGLPHYPAHWPAHLEPQKKHLGSV